jgi:tRNA 2-thiouridine synthesizing protein A
MKDAVVNNEIEIDTSGTECPIPILRARKVCQSAPAGAIIKIIATDPLAEADFHHYCEQSKYNIINIEKSGDKLYIRFKI